MPTDATGREILGYDENGNPIYADENATFGAGASSGPLDVGGNSEVGGTLTAAATGGIYGEGKGADAIGFMTGYSPAKGLGEKLGLWGGGGDDDKEAQTQLAKDVTAQSTGNAQAIYDAALRQAAAASGYQGPQAVQLRGITGPEVIDPRQFYTNVPTTAYATDASGVMRGYTAQQAQAFDAASRMQQATTTDVNTVVPADVGGVDTTINAPTVGDAAQTSRVGVERVGGVEAGDALRAEQIAAARSIAGGPSAAQDTFKATYGTALQEQLAIAARARGAERAGARRSAILAAGSQGATAALSAAALAAQEEQAKRVAASAALGGIRQSDITTATTGAQIRAQQANLQAQLDAAIAQGNTAAINDIQTKQAELALSARQSEVTAGLNQQQTRAALEQANLQARQQKAMADAAARNAASSQFAQSYNTAAQNAATAQTNVSLANAQLGTQAAKDLADAQNKAAQEYAAANTQTSQFNVTAGLNQAQANAARGVDVSKFNVEGAQKAKEGTAQLQQQAETTNVQSQLEAEKIKQAGTTSALGAGTAATGVQAENARTIVDANKAGSAAEAQKEAGLIGAGGALITAVASDERLKEDVSPVGTGTATYDELEEKTRRMYPNQAANTRKAFDAIDRGESGLAQSPSNRNWAEFYGRNADADFQTMMDAYALKKAAGREIEGTTSDERTKLQVDQMDSQDIQDWASEAKDLPVTFRYKPGVEDGGKDAHLGFLAQDLEATGPLGKMMVHKRPDGMRTVEYGPAALMMAKAALDKQDSLEAMLAQALNRSATSSSETSTRRRPPMEDDGADLAPALALAAIRDRKGARR